MTIKKQSILLIFAAATGFGLGSFVTYKSISSGNKQTPANTAEKNTAIKPHVSKPTADTTLLIDARIEGIDAKDSLHLTAHVWPGQYADIVVAKKDFEAAASSFKDGDNILLPAAIPLRLEAPIVTGDEKYSKSEKVKGRLAAKVIKAIDGDTFEAEVTLTGGMIVLTHVRIAGIDTPEKGSRAKCDGEAQKGEEASAFAKKLLQGQTVYLTDVFFDKYGGRVVATVMMPGQKPYADIMIGKGLAKPYDGGTKSSWCK